MLNLRAALLLAALAALAARTPSTARAQSEVSASTQTAAVTLGGRAILSIRAPLASLSVQERAERASARIEKAVGSPFGPAADIAVIEGESASDITAGDLIVMSVTDKDASAEGVGRAELAKRDAGLIREALGAYKHERGLRHLAGHFLIALLMTGLFVLALKLLNRIYGEALPALDAWARKSLPSLKIKNLELIPAARVCDALRALSNVFRIALTVVLLYLYFTSVLSLFPWTQGLAGHLFGYIFSPLKLVFTSVVNFIPNLFFIVVFIAVVRYALKIVRTIFAEVGAGRLAFPGFYPEWAQPTYQILRFLVIAFSAVVIFPYLPGSNSPAFQGISVFLGVLLSFGSSSAISNVIAGVILTYMRPFKLGDRVKISDTVGDILEKTLLVTRVRTIKNEDVTIPNAMVLSSHIVNYSSSAQGVGLILHTGVTIGYDVPWKKVHELLITAAQATSHVLKEPRPFVLQTSLDDFYVSYEVNSYTNEPNKMALIYSEMHQNIQDKFNEGGVEILSPHYSQLRDGNATTIPENYLPSSYRAPSFRVENPGRGADPR